MLIKDPGMSPMSTFTKVKTKKPQAPSTTFNNSSPCSLCDPTNKQGRTYILANVTCPILAMSSYIEEMLKDSCFEQLGYSFDTNLYTYPNMLTSFDFPTS